MLKSLQKANAVTLMVMTTVCILMRVTAVGKMNPETQKKEFDFWPPTQKMMAGGGFRNDLMNY